jgi:hypothetical protein
MGGGCAAPSSASSSTAGPRLVGSLLGPLLLLLLSGGGGMIIQPVHAATLRLTGVSGNEANGEYATLQVAVAAAAAGDEVLVSAGSWAGVQGINGAPNIIGGACLPPTPMPAKDQGRHPGCHPLSTRMTCRPPRRFVIRPPG